MFPAKYKIKIKAILNEEKKCMQCWEYSLYEGKFKLCSQKCF